MNVSTQQQQPNDNAVISLAMNDSGAAANGSINMSDPATLLADTTPNSKPRQQTAKKLQTYIYQDFANAEPSTLATGTCHERVPPQSLQSQKLPSKLAAMLSDPDLNSILSWMPHGRSWKILNREMFSSFALTRYFGHANHASFVRIVNAWGFRRITKGPDRDSYYHELFLRGKPRLHERMKRLPTCHRKTPVDKDDKYPDFYELAKTSPLPEVAWSFGGSSSGGSAAPNIVRTNAMSQVTSGYGSNPMASLGMGMGNHNSMLTQQSNLMGGAGMSNPSAMDYLSNSNKQGNDVSSLLKLLRQQGSLQQQQQQQQSQQQQENSNNSMMNQNLMNQILRMQNPPNNQASHMGRTGNANSTLGQLATLAPSPMNVTSSTTGNQGMMNSLTSSMNMNMNGQQQARRLSNDKISVNDVVQLRSIERTNELLAQKLALLQQDTMMMKQGQGPEDGTDSKANNQHQQSSALKASVNMGLGMPLSNGAPSGINTNPSKEDMLLQMIRRENQRNTSTAPKNMNQDEGGNMSQGLNSLLKSLNGMQQQQQRMSM